MTIDIDELENRIKYHRPDQDAIDRIAQMRRLALDFSKAVRLMVPEGREQSIAYTKIEEALFWANAGIARDPEHFVETHSLDVLQVQRGKHVRS